MWGFLFISMKDILTIVIPCKNEKINIYECLEFISKQKNIKGVKVIIADISNEEESLHWLYKAKYDFMNILEIKIIEGGFPAKGRLEGSKLVTTPYILFLDADMILIKPDVLFSISQYKKDLVSVTICTEKKWNWVFKIFYIFQVLSIKLKTPFAVGGFQYWNTKKYWELGGYDPLDLFAEDYRLSSKCDPNNFLIHKTNGVYTSSRRFENKGILYMFLIMVKSYLNRNNPDFFKKHHNYWN